MSNGSDLRKPSERQAAADRINDQSRGFEVLNSLVESCDSDLTFPDHKAAAEEAKKATFDDRGVRLFDAALYRSLRFSVVGGVYCHNLAMRGHYRALYEGARLMHPLKQ